MVKSSKYFLVALAVTLFVMLGGYVEAKTKVTSKLLQANVLTYLSKMLVNPTDSTDGTVKKAAALTQSCPIGKAMQGFDANGKVECLSVTTSAPATKTPSDNSFAEAKAVPPHLEGKNGSFGCSTIRDRADNYVVSCNSSLGKICLYVSNSSYVVGNWYCAHPSGFSIAASTSGCFSTVEAATTGSHYLYKINCNTNTGKVCSYEGSTNSQGGLNGADWKCMQMTDAEKLKEFR